MLRPSLLHLEGAAREPTYVWLILVLGQYKDDLAMSAHLSA